MDRTGTLWERGRRAWPGIGLTRSEFEAAVGCGAEAQSLAALRSLNVEDLFLAVACGKADDAALAAFEDRVMPAVDGALRRAEASESEIDEVKQALRERLFVPVGGKPPRIVAYRGRGRLRAWLQVAAIRTLSNLRRSRAAEVASKRGSLPELIVTREDPELARLEQGYRQQFERALARAVECLKDDERTLLRRYWVEGMVSEELAGLYGVHRATVSRWLIRAQKSLADATHEQLRLELDLSEGGLDSVMRLIRSRLDASLFRLLREADEAEEETSSPRARERTSA